MSFKINYTIPVMSDTSSLTGLVNTTNTINGAAGSGSTGPTGAAGSGSTGPTGAAGLSLPKFITRFTTSGTIPATANIWFGQPSFNSNDSSTIVPGTFAGNGGSGTIFTFTAGGTYDIGVTFTYNAGDISTSLSALLKIMNGGSTFYQGYALNSTTSSIGATTTLSQRVIVKDIVAGYTMFVSYDSSGTISLNSGGTMTILQVGN